MDERLARDIERLRRRSANVRLNELLKVWADAGGTFRTPRGGSHYRLYLGSRMLSVPLRRPVLEVYVHQVLDVIALETTVSEATVWDASSDARADASEEESR
jgi:hypothetical protein